MNPHTNLSIALYRYFLKQKTGEGLCQKEHQEHTIIVHGLAKAYSMTGWRIGFLAAPKPIAKAINALQSHSTSNPTSFAQYGAIQALDGPQNHIPEWLGEFNKRRCHAYDQLNKMKNITCVNAQGAFYLFPNISTTGMKSIEFCEKLLSEAKVAAVPGIALGADDYIRICYATSMENLNQALIRLSDFASKI